MYVVRADVVTIAPDVSGPGTAVTVRDNQPVKRGDVLFRIDPDRFDWRWRRRTRWWRAGRRRWTRRSARRHGRSG